METVIETPAFTISAKKAGMTETERFELVSYLAANPDAGDLIVGSGGCRKIRFAGKGRGKSGGYRVATVYATSRGVFLLYVLFKGSAATFTDVQISEMAAIAKRLKAGSS